MSKEKVALTKEQVNTLRDALCTTSAYLFCMIALYAGLRTEEILALQWDCVSLEAPASITVMRASRFDHNRPIIEERLKTPAARRTIPIPTVLVRELSHAKENSSSNYVISNQSGEPLTKSQFATMWRNVTRRKAKERVYYRKENGVKVPHVVKAELGSMAKRGKFVYSIDFDVSPHILRHTYITNLLLAGVDIKKVQYLAGHEKSKTTLEIYNHLVYNRPEDLLEKVRAAIPCDIEGV